MTQPRLTAAQARAIDSQHHCIVKAGAGSGKTTILVGRFLKILSENTDLNPSHILAITFTNKAAREMLERIREQLTPTSSDSPKQSLFKRKTLQQLHLATVTTIHGFCAQVLRQFPAEADLDPTFTILSEVDAHDSRQRAIMTGISALQAREATVLETLLLNGSLRQLQRDLAVLMRQRHQVLSLKHPEKHLIDLLKEANEDDRRSTKEAMVLSKALLAVFQHCEKTYQDSKRRANVVDHDDLLAFTSTLIHKHPQICQTLQSNYPYLLVDEFQDTDPIQWAILKRLTDQGHKHPPTLFLVGDIKQSIYKFRGADSKIFDQATKHILNTYPKAESVSLQDNFRSQQPIITFTNTLFEPLFDRYSLHYDPLICQNETSSKSDIRLNVLDDAHPENQALAIAEWINHIRSDNPTINPQDIAVLTRRKKPLTDLHNAFENIGLQSILASGSRTLLCNTGMHISNLIAAVYNRYDNLALMATLTGPLFQVPHDTIYALYQEDPSPLLYDKAKALKNHNLPFGQTLNTALNTLNNLASAAFENTTRMWIEAFLEQNNHRQLLLADETQDNPEAILEDTLTRLDELDQTAQTHKGQLAHRLRQAIQNPSEQTSRQTDKRALQLLTIHAAKGLEFDAVVIADAHHTFNLASSDRIPIDKTWGIGLSHRSQNKGQNLQRKQVLTAIKQQTIEEELRLFYVACTRAKHHLLIQGQKSKISDKEPLSYFDFIFQRADKDRTSLTLGNLHIPIHENPTTQDIPKWKDARKSSDETQPITPLGISTAKQKLITSTALLAHLNATTSRQSPTSSTTPQLGLDIHTALEQLAQGQPLPPLSVQAKAHVEITQKNPLFQGLCKAKNKVLEAPFTLATPICFIEGRLDAAFFDGQVWQLLDYKSTDDTQSRQKDPQYASQLLIYAKALAMLKQCSLESISAAIIFTATGESRVFSFSLTDWEDLLRNKQLS